MATLGLVPGFAERISAATRETRFVGTAVPNYLRKPYGPGWALVGDAGYNKDFITAFGMDDAFRDAERCARALDEGFTGTRPFHEALADYHSARDHHVLPFYQLTAQIAALEPPPPDLAQLLSAASQQPGSHGRLRQGHRRRHLAGRVLLRGQRPPHSRGRDCELRARRSEPAAPTWTCHSVATAARAIPPPARPKRREGPAPFVVVPGSGPVSDTTRAHRTAR